jgi:Zn-dependent oligopeptidase
MLTEQQEGLAAGIRGVEWDAVELPSQVGGAGAVSVMLGRA